MVEEIGKSELIDLVEHYFYKEFNTMKREYNVFSVNAAVADILDMELLPIYNKVVPSYSRKSMFYDMLKDPISYIFPSITTVMSLQTDPLFLLFYLPVSMLLSWMAHNANYDMDLMDDRRGKIYIKSSYGAEGCGTLAHELTHLYNKALAKKSKEARDVFMSEFSEGVARGVQIDVLNLFGYSEEARFSSLAELLMKYAYEGYERNSLIEKAVWFCTDYVKSTKLRDSEFYQKFIEYLNNIILNEKKEYIYFAKRLAGFWHIDGWTKVAYLRSKGKKLKDIIRGQGKI